ncbi:MAG TPA: hypothetical protein ENK57_24000, partial [Polyangiaceae bacterium]|nr:hypothetical protein [Polyangiaceae bacterium]
MRSGCTHQRRLSWVALLLIVAAAGCEEPPLLVVNLRTNYRPGLEFNRVEVALYPGSSAAALDVPSVTVPARPFTREADARASSRVAEVAGLSTGTWIVQARLMQGTEMIASGLVVTDLHGTSLAVTVRVTRECEGVECPAEGSLSEIACLAGRCVDPRCSPESPERCGLESCEHDDECAPTSGVECASGICLAGVCAGWLDDDRCADGQLCFPDVGCRDVSMDAGPPDAGAVEMDGGVDAGAPIDIVQVRAGGTHACAVRSTGQVLCWGGNNYGKLGDGTTSDRATPVEIEVPPGAAQVRPGALHTCAVTRDGQVLCWGGNDYGQLGDGTTSERHAPTSVAGIADAVEIGSGEYHTCARRATGAVLCWGRNADGQLGDGSTTDRHSPSEVAGITDAVQLAVGGFHTCALRATGATVCWGSNSNGQLAVTGADRPVPTPVPELPDAVELSAGGFHTCARRPAGQVVCWGKNEDRQLGDGTTTDRYAPVGVTGLSDAIDIATGWAHTCALRSDGEVRCFGSNAYGQLGIGSISERDAPVEVTVGDFFSCARGPRGRVYCWGAAQSGQLGDGDPTGILHPPAAVVGLSDAVSLTAGDTHSCAVRAGGGRVCWGHVGVDVAYATPSTGSDVDGRVSNAVYAGRACSVLESGAVECAGVNSLGQLGDGTTDDRSSPVVVAGVSDALEIGAGIWRTCARLSSGGVDCWGGLGSPADRARAPIPGVGDAVGFSLGLVDRCVVRATGAVLCGDTALTVVSGVADATWVGTAFGNTCALRRGGGVWCWGDNDRGQLGDGTTTDRTSPVAVQGLSDAVGLTVGVASACALRGGGSVVCWGAGYGGGEPPTDATTPTPIAGLTDAVELVGGHGHACARRAGGTVVCWGGNSEGQLGR